MSEPPPDPSVSRTTGGIIFVSGVVGLALGVLTLAGAPVSLPLGGPLWTLLFVVVSVAGAAMIWSTDHPRTDWSPSVPGRRFRTAVLYTRADCPLCDEAHDLLARYSQHLPELILVNVDEEPPLVEKFGTCVPVLELDGQVRFRGGINEPLLQRLIEGTPPTILRPA